MPPDPSFPTRRSRLCPTHLLIIGVLFSVPRLCADDWPQWMGPQRDGVWRESGILERFPADGPKVLWRVPIAGGYSGPAVAAGRLYVMDRPAGTNTPAPPGAKNSASGEGVERIVCRSAEDGALLWQHPYPCKYRIAYPSGPRSTPLVADAKVFTLGAMGHLHCLNATNGTVLWSRRFVEDLGAAEPPVWGYAAHPLLDEERLICLVGATNAAVVALHKDTGDVLWRALDTREIGYAPPVLCTIGQTRQLIIWSPDLIAGLNPVTGQVLWSLKYPMEGQPQRPGVTIALPRLVKDHLFLTSYYHGSTMLQLTADPPGASVVWDRHSSRKSTFNDGLHSVMCTPLLRNGYIFGMCGQGELRCLKADTGDRVWETMAVAGEPPTGFPNVFIVENQDRQILWTDHGELILARLTPEGYQELDRAKLLEPVESTRGREVLWCHPAFANRRAYMHNGKELIAVGLGNF